MSTFTRFGKAVRVMAVALGAVAMAATAEAVDLRSWDQVITDGTKRFAVLSAFNNQAVLDKETQLVWTRQHVPFSGLDKYDYFNARHACLSAKVGGRGGWRLPFAHEVLSLLDDSAPAGAPKLPANHPFGGIGKQVWTATTIMEGVLSNAYTLVSTWLAALFAAEAHQEVDTVLCVRGYASQ